MKFDIHVSKYFKGGKYFSSFASTTADDAMIQIMNAWDEAGLEADSGEAFIFAHIDVQNAPVKIELGTFKHYEDGEIFFETKDSRFFEETEFFANDYVEAKEVLIACLAHVIQHGA
jgi:hypothetical protein